MRYLFECMLITLNVISACEHVIDITPLNVFFMNEDLLITENVCTTGEKKNRL